MGLVALNALRSRDFRLLFASTATSTIGDWLDFVAILVLVSVVWHRGAFGLAAVSVAVAVPQLAAPFVGVLVDRAAPRTLMVGADLVRAGVTAAMVVAPSLWVLVVLLAMRSAAATAFGPTAQAVIKRTVPADNLLSANASMQVVVQTLKVTGPAAGGALLAVIAPTTLIGFNALTFLVSALILTGLRVPGRSATSASAGYLAELREGLSFIRRTQALRLLLTALAGTVFLVFLFDSMMALLVPELGLSRSYIGYLVAAVGVGGVAGSAALAQWGAAARPFLLVGTGQLAAGGLVALMGAGAIAAVAAPGAAWLAVALFIGVAAAGVTVGFPTIVQTATPDHLIGRVSTAVGAVPTLLQVLAPATGAVILTATGVGVLFVASGAGLVLLALMTLVRQRRLLPAAAFRSSPVAGTPPTVDIHGPDPVGQGR
jgi:MFS family permease